MRPARRLLRPVPGNPAMTTTTSPSLARRVAATDISGIRKVFDLAADLQDPIDLSIGQPDFDVPDAVKDAAAAAIRGGTNRYTRTQGAPELRAALLAHLGGRYDESELLVTSAVSGGLLLSFLALLDPDDEILIPEPYFVMYKQLALMLGARPVCYDTYPDWSLDPERIAGLITPRTKVICINSPCNPTGKVYARDELAALAEKLAPSGIVAVSDEIYAPYCYDAPFASFAEVYENTLLLGGFSKSHAMTGWRIGYAAGPAPLIAAMTKFQQFTFVCAPAPFQQAAVAALLEDTAAMVDTYRHKRDRLYAGLLDAGYEVEKPGGAFYIFPRVPWGEDMEFVAACIAENLLVIPGSVFSEQHSHFRIAYPTTDETIDRGLAVLRRLRSGPVKR